MSLILAICKSGDKPLVLPVSFVNVYKNEKLLRMGSPWLKNPSIDDFPTLQRCVVSASTLSTIEGNGLRGTPPSSPRRWSKYVPALPHSDRPAKPRLKREPRPYWLAGTFHAALPGRCSPGSRRIPGLASLTLEILAQRKLRW